MSSLNIKTRGRSNHFSGTVLVTLLNVVIIVRFNTKSLVPKNLDSRSLQRHSVQLSLADAVASSTNYSQAFLLLASASEVRKLFAANQHGMS